MIGIEQYISAPGLVDDVTVLGENINNINKITESLLEAGRDVCLDVNTEKTKYKVMSQYQNARQNHNLLTTDNPLKM
jgi:hypothetical protein